MKQDAQINTFFLKKKVAYFFSTRIAPISIPTKRKYQSNIQENRGEGEGDREEREGGEARITSSLIQVRPNMQA